MTPKADSPGPLTDKVLEYERVMTRLVPTIASPPHWEPLSAFVAVDTFERVGTFLERQDVTQYTDMLTRWAGAIDTFETSVRRITERPAAS